MEAGWSRQLCSEKGEGGNWPLVTHLWLWPSRDRVESRARTRGWGMQTAMAGLGVPLVGSTPLPGRRPRTVPLTNPFAQSFESLSRVMLLFCLKPSYCMWTLESFELPSFFSLCSTSSTKEGLGKGIDLVSIPQALKKEYWHILNSLCVQSGCPS